MPQKEAIAKAPASRPQRTKLGTRNVLTLSGKEPGYEYRFVNDESDRVQDFLDRGWEIVEKKNVRIGDKRVGNPESAEGVAATASVGRGVKAYVMRIREDWYKEDQAEKQAAADALESGTKQEALDGTYGELKITRN